MVATVAFSWLRHFRYAWHTIFSPALTPPDFFLARGCFAAASHYRQLRLLRLAYFIAMPPYQLTIDFITPVADIRQSYHLFRCRHDVFHYTIAIFIALIFAVSATSAIRCVTIYLRLCCATAASATEPWRYLAYAYLRRCRADYFR